MFKNLKNYEVKGRTSKLDMPELGEEARIEVKPATEENSQYYNAMLRVTGKRVRRFARGQMDARDIRRNRDEDRVLYAKYVVVGWENVESDRSTEEKKDYVPFSKENAAELLKILPAQLMDRVRNHAADPEEFYVDEDDAPPDAEELAKNFGSDSASS